MNKYDLAMKQAKKIKDARKNPKQVSKWSKAIKLSLKVK